MSVASLSRREGPKLGNWGLTPLHTESIFWKNAGHACDASLCMLPLDWNLVETVYLKSRENTELCADIAQILNNTTISLTLLMENHEVWRVQT